MKVIFVTIQEFLDNGGKLEIGRTIYREYHQHIDESNKKNDMLMATLEAGTYIGENGDTGTYLLKNATFKSYPVGPTVGYVKIKITPSYE